MADEYTPDPSLYPTPQQMSPAQFAGFLSQMSPEQQNQMRTYFSAGTSTRNTPNETPIQTNTQNTPNRPPVTPPSARSRTRSRGRRSGGGGGCCGGSGGTDASTPPRERPDPDTASEASTPMSSRRRYDSTPRGNPQNRQYTFRYGSIVKDDVGSDMHSRIRELCGVFFADNVMEKFSNLPREDVDRLIAQIKAEYSPAPGSGEVTDAWVRNQMVACMSHRRSDIRQAAKHGSPRPGRVPREVYERERHLYEENPQRFSQQEEAAKTRLEGTGSSHLGSGGWDSFNFYFERVVGRLPNDAEKKFAFKNNTYQLLEKLDREGVNIDWAYVTGQEIPNPPENE